MKKRGQATYLIIAGLIILAVILLLFFLQKRIIIGPVTQESIESELPVISEHVESCLFEAGEKYIRQLGIQGGYIELPKDTFRQYFNGQEANKISYLCYDISQTRLCRNRMLTKAHMQTELSKKLIEELSVTCLHKTNIQKQTPYDVSTEQLQINVNIGDDSTIITANYPITLSKNNLKTSKDNFLVNIELPLGRLYDTSTEIVNSEAVIGDFETLTYSVQKTKTTGKPYIAQKLQPYPDKLYILKIKDTPIENPFIFQFFIQGESRFE